MGIPNITTMLTVEELITEIENESQLLLDLQLDILLLDVAWVAQPQISFKWNRFSNIADHLLRKKENDTKKEAAELYLDIRTNHVELGEKYTEGLLTNEVAAAPKMLELKEDVLFLQHLSNILISGKKSVDDRRRALESLVSLFATHYFTSNTDNPVLRELSTDQTHAAHSDALANNKRLNTLKQKKGENE